MQLFFISLSHVPPHVAGTRDKPKLRTSAWDASDFFGFRLVNPVANHYSISFLKRSGIFLRRILLAEGFITLCVRTKGFGSKLFGVTEPDYFIRKFPAQS